MLHGELTNKIIGIFYRVYNVLGFGFLEKVYENALAYEFKKEGLSFLKQAPICVLYEGEVMGKYFADFVVEGKVIVEVKADKFLGEDSEKQLLNYLRATGLEVGLVLGFGKKADIKRKVFESAKSNDTRMNAGFCG